MEEKNKWSFANRKIEAALHRPVMLLVSNECIEFQRVISKNNAPTVIGHRHIQQLQRNFFFALSISWGIRNSSPQAIAFTEFEDYSTTRNWNNKVKHSSIILFPTSFCFHYYANKFPDAIFYFFEPEKYLPGIELCCITSWQYDVCKHGWIT